MVKPLLIFGSILSITSAYAKSPHTVSEQHHKYVDDYDRMLQHIIDDATTNEEEFNPWPERGDGSFALGVWGQAQTYPEREGRLEEANKRSHLFTFTHSNYAKPYSVRRFLQGQDQRGQGPMKTSKAPLIFFFEGIRTDINGWYAFQNIRKFIKRGYHVVSVSSPFGESALNSHPHMLPGIAHKDAEVNLETIRAVIDNIGKEHISSVNILGLSYGSFLASAVAAKDSEITKKGGTKPLINGNVLLIAPPESAKHSFLFVDDMILDHIDDFKRSKGLPTVFRLLRYLEAKKPEDLSTADIKASKVISYLIGGQLSLLEAVRQIQKFKPTKLSSPLDESYRFTNYFKDFHQLELKDLDETPSKLVTWLDIASENGVKITALSTHDDPVFPNKIIHKRIKFLPSTGHAGFRYLPIYDDILTTYFGPETMEDSPDLINISQAVSQLISEKNNVKKLLLLAKAQESLSAFAHDLEKQLTKLEKKKVGGRSLPVFSKDWARQMKKFFFLNSLINTQINALYKSDPTGLGGDTLADGGIGDANRRIWNARGFESSDEVSVAYRKLNEIQLNGGSSIIQLLSHNETGTPITTSIYRQYQVKKNRALNTGKNFTFLSVTADVKDAAKSTLETQPFRIHAGSVNSFDYTQLSFFRSKN